MSADLLRRAVEERLPDGPIVVALGGGADSAVAAWACARHRGVRTVWVDHGLEASAVLGARAAAVAAALGLEHKTLAAPVAAGPNLEDRARQARWAAIEAEASRDEVVVTGHTSDDLAETFLINLLRGAGTTGLAGMAVSRPDRVRPLLGFRRAQVRALADELALPYADDPDNVDDAFLRNRLRSDLIPMLERDYQPTVVDTLVRAGRLLAADDVVLEDAAAEIPLRSDGHAVLIPAAMLAAAPEPVAARAVRRALRRIHPPYAGASADVTAVLGLARGGGATRTLTGAVTAAREGPSVALWMDPVPIPDPVSLHEGNRILWGSLAVTAIRALARGPYPRSTVVFDPSVLAAGATLRTAEEGDRIDIEAGTKLVRDALAEMQVPPRLRPAWPVVADDAKIAAIVGGRVAPWARPAGDEAIAIDWERA